MKNVYREASALISESEYAIALTGAGISAESGLDTFRGGGGLWEKFKPEEYATISAFRQNPKKCWDLFFAIGDIIDKAKPNLAHEVLAEWETKGLIKSVITQNVDSLHQRAGSKNVVEFHGSHAKLHCISCGYEMDSPSFETIKEIPNCKCGNVLKPAVVLFGEAIPHTALIASERETSRCDCLLVIGTSAQVAPASFIPFTVMSNGGKIIEINPEATPVSNISSLVIRGSSSEALPGINSYIRREN